MANYFNYYFWVLGNQAMAFFNQYTWKFMLSLGPLAKRFFKCTLGDRLMVCKPVSGLIIGHLWVLLLIYIGQLGPSKLGLSIELRLLNRATQWDGEEQDSTAS